MTRALIVVDIETTGLHHGADVLEVAAVNVDTGKELYFVPHIEPERFKHAQPKAMQINRYFERGVWADMKTEERTRRWYADLRRMLEGNTFAGSNPTFDSRILSGPVGAVWHHRLADLANYTAGRVWLDPAELPGLEEVCKRLGVVNESPHSALGDARATAECFRRLRPPPAEVEVEVECGPDEYGLAGGDGE